MLVKLDTTRIVDWKTFHDVFAEAFGFPAFYGRNLDAWIDCMTNLDDAATGMTTVYASSDGIVTLQLEDVDNFAERCPEQYTAVIECAAFVNWRKISMDKSAVLALSFYKTPSR